MEIIDEKTPGKEDNVENIFFFIREKGEQHFLINFEMFLYIISDKSENYGKMWLKWRKLIEKRLVKSKMEKTHVHYERKLRSSM